MGVNDRANDKKYDRKREKVEKERQLTLDGLNAAFVGFVNVDLSNEDKATFVTWRSDVNFPTALQYFIDDGCVISFKVDQRSGGYAAAATQRRESSVNAGLCINMRASDPIKALERLVFVLAAIVGENWKLYAAGEQDDEW